MNLSDLMDVELVDLDLPAGGTEAVLSCMVDRMHAAGVIGNKEDALGRLVEREKVMSTGIGGGIAIPHARTPGVTRTVVVLGRSVAGVEFDAVDGKPVEVVFLILGPPESSAEHVKVLARIARLVKQPEFHAAVLQAESAELVMQAVRRHQ
jgi:PTS system nitrogen regulatory IIA component